MLGIKEGPARAETIRTLLQRPGHGPSESIPSSTIPSTDLASAFLDLTRDEQYTLLSDHWDRMKVSTMIPALEQLLDQDDLKNQLLRDAAFQRLYDLDPAKATPLMLAEIRQPHLDSGMFTVTAKTLGVLPDRTLSQFDDLLAKRFADTNSRARELDGA